jgi:hypothetical protein
MLPHHDQQASEDRNPTKHGTDSSFYHASAKSHLPISVTFSTPTRYCVNYEAGFQFPSCRPSYDCPGCWSFRPIALSNHSQFENHNFKLEQYLRQNPPPNIPSRSPELGVGSFPAWN